MGTNANGTNGTNGTNGKGGKRIMIGVPFYKHLPEPKFDLAVANLVFYLVQNGYYVDLNYKEGTIVSSQRNALFEDALNEGYDLLMLDTDMEFSAPDAVKIIDCTVADVVGGLYFASRRPYNPLVFSADMVDDEGVFKSYGVGDIPQEPWTVPAVAIGVGFFRHSAIKHMMEDTVVKRIGRPFNHWQLPSGRELGEDLSFCHRCNLEGISMACVPNVDIGHIGKRTIRKQDHKFEVSLDYHYCNDIEGWMTVREQGWLHDRARDMGKIVEIGAWKGKSTHALCSGSTRGRVISIDHFVGTDDPKQVPHRSEIYGGAFKQVDAGVDVYEIFLRNTACFNNLQVMRMNSTEAFRKLNFADDFLPDMTFIDGGHQYDEVMADLRNYEPRTTRLICGHDYSSAFAGVVRAVDEYFAGKARVQKYDSIWFVEKG